MERISVLHIKTISKRINERVYINYSRKKYFHNKCKNIVKEKVLCTIKNRKRSFNSLISNLSSDKLIFLHKGPMCYMSNSASYHNLYLDNYSNIKKYINSIDNDDPIIVNTLKEKTYNCIQNTKEKLKAIMRDYPNAPISICTPNNIIGGLRNIITLITDTSILEKKRGILFRGKTVDKVLKEFPKWDENCEYPIAEAMFWFLLTNEIPEKEQLALFSRELYLRATKIPQFVFEFIDNIPTFTHPMAQLLSTVAFLESFSLFKFKYSEGIPKTDYWKYVLEDAISLLAHVQVIGAYIYKRTFIDNSIKKGKNMELDPDFDWSANFSKLLGYDNKQVSDLLRLYFILHSDHEGCNPSAHSSHLIGSTLANPYLSFSGCVAALSGPLHGLANQECLNFILDIKNKLGDNELTFGFIENYAKGILNSGRVIPGYGHAILRIPDPRFIAQRNFALSHFPNDPLVKILEMCYKVIPGILISTGKVKNPYPNVDLYSGSLLYHYGISFPQYYTVLFSISRCIGVMSQLVISRGLSLPLERPKSVDINNLKNICENNYVKIEEFE